MNKKLGIIKKTLKGKTFYRILFEKTLGEFDFDVRGICVDLAAGAKNIAELNSKILPEKLIKVDIDEKSEPDIIADFNGALPFDDSFADNVFFFNSFYLLKDPVFFLSELLRILKNGGRVFFTVELIKAEETGVFDRQRYSSRKIKEILGTIGFTQITAIPIGERFCAAANLVDFSLGNSWPANLLKIPGRLFCLLLDKLTPKKLIKNYPCPISWFIAARK